MKYQSVTSIVVFLLGTSLVHVGCVPVETPHQSLTQTSSSLGLSATDSRFRVRVKFGETSLPQTSCYINTLDFMANLAARNYNGMIRATTGPVAPEYTGVVIEIRLQPPAETIFTKFVIWGLYYLITIMTQDNMWKTAVLGMFWDGKIVGWIRFQTPKSNNGSQVELQDLQNQMQSLTGEALLEASIDLDNTSTTLFTDTLTHSSALAAYNVSKSTAKVSESDFNLTMSPIAGGTPLIPAQVFLPLISTLKDVAPYNVNSHVTPFKVGISAIHSSVQWDLPRGSNVNDPPSFEYRWVIEATREIPRLMLKRRFAESSFFISVNDHIVGWGEIVSSIIPRSELGTVSDS